MAPSALTAAPPASPPQVSILVTDATALVQEAQSRHGTSPTASAALGRTLMGGLLLGAFRKDEETVQLNFNGRGPLGNIVAVANTQGLVKGYVANPAADPPLRPDGKLNVGGAVGPGTLHVIRSHPAYKEPYTGVVPLHSGEIAEDLAVYLSDSEQTQCAIGLGVTIGRDGSVTAAGGYMLSVLPFAEEETIAALETSLRAAPSPSEMIGSGMSVEQMTAALLGDVPFDSLGDLTPKYGPCEVEDLRGRMKRAIAMLGQTEVQSILEEQGELEITCEFCKETYKMTEADVEEVLARSSEFEVSDSAEQK